MYAIIETGGKQYTVKEGDVIHVERLEADKEGKVSFKEVLFLGGSATKIGQPFVSGCTVLGELLKEERGPKVVAFKYKQRKNTRRKVGHRQTYSVVKITKIKG